MTDTKIEIPFLDRFPVGSVWHWTGAFDDRDDVQVVAHDGDRAVFRRVRDLWAYQNEPPADRYYSGINQWEFEHWYEAKYERVHYVDFTPAPEVTP